MSDINIEEDGDLLLTSDLDISLSSPKELIRKLIIRALRTPKFYIGRYSSDANLPYTIDSTFGDLLYSRLSEPLNVETISNINKDVREAIGFVLPNLQLVTVDVGINTNEVLVNVSYSDNGEENNIQITI